MAENDPKVGDTAFLRPLSGEEVASITREVGWSARKSKCTGHFGYVTSVSYTTRGIFYGISCRISGEVFSYVWPRWSFIWVRATVIRDKKYVGIRVLRFE